MLPAEQILLASGGYDGTVWLWDPATSRPAGPPLEDDLMRVQGVWALAAVPLPGGRTLLASGYRGDSTVRLWDLAIVKRGRHRTVSRRSRAHLLRVMASNGLPYWALDRVLTSQITSTWRSAATMSISPSAHRQLRSRIRNRAHWRSCRRLELLTWGYTVGSRRQPSKSHRKL